MPCRLPLLIAVATFALARAAFAADPAGVSPASPVATAPSDATAAQIETWLADDGEPASTDAAGPPPEAAARAIHGQASIGFGSNGYREAEVSAVIPVSQTGALGIAVGDQSFRGYNRRNLAVSLVLGTAAVSEPCGVRHTGVQLASDAARRARCSDAEDLAGQ